MTDPAPPVRVLWLTTKHPWPPHDGGRLLVSEMLAALDPERVRVTLAGPWEAGGSRRDQLLRAHAPALERSLGLGQLEPLGLLPRTLGALGIGQPLSQRSFQAPPRVRELSALAPEVDIVHLEQPHAYGLMPTPSASSSGSGNLLWRRPRLLRAQNVEWDLWRRFARSAKGVRRALIQRQAAAIRRFEQESIERSDALVAISDEDLGSFECSYSAACLQLSEPACCIEPAIPAWGRAEWTQPRDAPRFLMPCGSSWAPNRVGEVEFVRDAWPRIADAVEGARLLLFTNDGVYGERLRRIGTAGVEVQSYPERSAEIFGSGALVVPALCTSGVRMKILEAFARGVPVLTTEAGARGLGSMARDAALVVASAASKHTQAENWVAAARATLEPKAIKQRVEAALAALVEHHQPARIGDRYAQLCQRLVDRTA